MKTLRVSSSAVTAWVLVAASLTLTGCATYLDAKSATAEGGRIDQQKAAAEADLSAARTERDTLTTSKVQIKGELREMEERLRVVDADLRRQEQALAKAQKDRKLSATRHAALKKELDDIRAEAQSLELQNKGDALKPADESADKAKAQRLRELEDRKKKLESALAQLAGG